MYQERKFCNVCGAPLEGGEKFCIACGTPIDATAPVPQPGMFPPGGPPTQPPGLTQPYGFQPPPAKKSNAPLIFGVLGGLLLLIVVALLVFFVMGKKNTEVPATAPGTSQNTTEPGAAKEDASGVIDASQRPQPVTAGDYLGTWYIHSVDSEPIDYGEPVEVRQENGQIRLAYAGYNLSFYLDLLQDGSLQGEAHTAGGEIFLAQGWISDGRTQMQVFMPAPENPSNYLFEMTLTR